MGRRQNPLVSLAIYLPLTALALLMLAPFGWMIVAALMPKSKALALEFLPPGKAPLIEKLTSYYTLSNFREVIANPHYPFLRFFLNSLVVASACGALVVLICTMGGYAFAKKSFPGKDLLFRVLLASMLVP